MENLKWNNRLEEPRETMGNFYNLAELGLIHRTGQDKTRYHNSKTGFKLKLAHSPV
jgi:hypothetical protein